MATTTFAGGIPRTTGGLPSPAPDSLSLAQKIAPYQSYNIDTFYRWFSGVLQVPVAQTPAGTPGTYTNRPSAGKVQTSAPYGQKLVVVTATRLNAMPVLPTPITTNSNETLLSVIINPQSPAIIPDMASRLFTIRAEYTYALTKPIWVPDGTEDMPITEADGNTRSSYGIGSIQFVQGLI